MCGAVVRGASHLALHGLRHGGMAMPQDQRTMAAEEIDVLVAVDVPFVRACRAVGVDGIWLQIAPDVGDAVRKQVAGSFE